MQYSKREARDWPREKCRRLDTTVLPCFDRRAVFATLSWDRAHAHRPLATKDQAFGPNMPLPARILAPHVTGWLDSALASAKGLRDGMAEHSPATDEQHLLTGRGITARPVRWKHQRCWFPHCPCFCLGPGHVARAS